MSSEWMKVMLDEIARKQLEATQAQIEQERRAAEGAPRTADGEPRHGEQEAQPALRRPDDSAQG